MEFRFLVCVLTSVSEWTVMMLSCLLSSFYILFFAFQTYGLFPLARHYKQKPNKN